MHVIDSGIFFTVALDEDEVTAFAETWPCFGPRAPIKFEFDRRNGDLVDVEGSTEEHDGAGLTVLSQDAYRLGVAYLERAGSP